MAFLKKRCKLCKETFITGIEFWKHIRQKHTKDICEVVETKDSPYVLKLYKKATEERAKKGYSKLRNKKR